MNDDLPSNMGCYLARRFVQLGIEDFFCVPGDYNLVLLDQFLREKKLRMINCCNELNAGYAADGYARAKGVAVLCVTFTVGGLSAINAVAGSYSDNLPVIVISGCPNSNDFSTERVVHHTIGLPQFSQVSSCFRQVTCHTAIIKSVENAAQKIDYAIEQALALRKPVYLEIACNLPAVEHYSFKAPVCPLSGSVEVSNREMLNSCVNEIVAVLDESVKPVLVAGSKMRRHLNSGSIEAFLDLADASGYAYACMPDAKGLVDENKPSFIGTYWGQVSDPFCCEAVESADRYIFVGPNFNDYTTVGYSTLISESKMIVIRGHEVVIGGSLRFHGVLQADVLRSLTKKVKRNQASLNNWRRMFVPPGLPPALGKGGTLTTNVLMHHIQCSLTSDMAIVVETGDSWFNGQKLRLPSGCGYECQMQYGSIGWSVGAVLGMSSALKDEKRVLALIGDGSFQMTCQEVSSMIKFGCNPIIVLINNDGYTIEVEIHDGPYNNIQSWNYSLIISAFATNASVYTYKVTTESEAEEALQKVIISALFLFYLLFFRFLTF
mmetsp:Transcript_13534/g.25895  ORF Transcript_13534/g.25895 Transcript_13534/m.25895 type:complete len:549 (-) Transcript_13534:202-1848(-)